MGLSTTLPTSLSEVDIIIAGGGTAGSVLAARLSSSLPTLSILLIERGPNNQTPTITHPAAFFAHLAPESKFAHFSAAKPSPHVADRALVVPSGSVLGGGSSINFMTYSRAQRCDFDAWETEGWGAEEVLPYIRRVERYISQYDTEGGNQDDNHGYEGPIEVSQGTYGSPKMQAEYVGAAAKMGWKEVPDRGGKESINAVWKIHRFISREGKRQDAASCYVHPRLEDGKHANLHVLVETEAVRVLFDEENEKAVGVEVRRSGSSEGDAGVDGVLRVKARKMVILASGALGTPLILERSGIGQVDVLEKAGVPSNVDLPGVGNDYQDHHLMSYAYKSTFGAEDTGDALLYGRMGTMEDLIKANHKILGWNAQELQGKFRPTEDEVDALGADFRKVWDVEFKDHPEKPLVVLNLIAGNPDPTSATGEPCIGITAFTVYPFSRGHIHITGSNLDDAVDFDTGFFGGVDGPMDVKKHVFAYKKQREVIRRMPSYRGEVAATHPPFAAKSPAACVELTEALPSDVKDIVYSAEDDEVLEKFIRERVATTWHSLGTCKMQPREKKGVVDAHLSVYGINRLKIADLSIAPGNVAANTNATALMIGEKAADIVIGELELQSN